MTSWVMRGVRRSVALLASGTVLAGVAAAQAPPARIPPGAVVQPLPREDGSELRRHLVTLADNPRSVDALVGAGRAALAMGDAEAALSFFGRAHEFSPRDARARAGMASALVHLGQPQTALTMFAEAVQMGAPEVEIAGERGLAFDLVGDPRRAQQDYALALRRADDAELRRRMALSLAISGQRDAALRLIDEQLRRNIRAGWRTQAFVLALTGDAAGAHRTAQGSMPPDQAAALMPFLQRLAALNPSQKALAVHLGRFPNGGQTLAASRPVNTAADPGALALATAGAAPPAAARPRNVQPAAAARPRNVQPAAAARPRTVQAETRTVRRGPSRPDSSDRFGLRDRRTSGSREAGPPTRETRSTAAVTQPARQATPANSGTAQARPQPAGAPPTQIAEMNTRWAGAPYSAAQPTASSPAAAGSPAPVPTQPRPTVPQATAVQPEVAPASTPPARPSGPPEVTATASPAGQAARPALLVSSQAGTATLPGPVAPARQAPAQSSPGPSLSAAAIPPSSSAATLQPSATVPPLPSTIQSSAMALPLPSTIQPIAIAPSSTEIGPGFSLEAGGTPPAPASPAPQPDALADIAALVQTLPREQTPEPASTPPPARSAGTSATRAAASAASRPPATRPARSRPAQPAHPARHWVQIAGGANRAALPRELARLRALAPEQLARRTAYTAPLRATNRLLVGPFASEREAQEFVNQLARRSVTAFAWTSEAGQEIERLQTGR